MPSCIRAASVRLGALHLRYLHVRSAILPRHSISSSVRSYTVSVLTVHVLSIDNPAVQDAQLVYINGQ